MLTSGSSPEEIYETDLEDDMRKKWRNLMDKNFTFSKKLNDPSAKWNLTEGERKYIKAWPTQKRAAFAKIPCAHCFQTGDVEKMKPARNAAATLRRWSDYLNLRCNGRKECSYELNAIS